MANRKFKDEQILKILKEASAGSSAKELCRKYGMTEQTFYRWKAKYGDMELSDIKKMQAMQDENTRLKRIIANQALEIDGIRLLLEKKF
jgi:putative transposase